MLFLVSTPIGNLSDMTYRAVEVLASCDYILCEDTRHSARLLQHYQIKKPCRSFHKFNEVYREDKLVEDLKNGKKVALISDAGTPGIADPGEKLVKRCLLEGISVTPIPGPCAAVAALSASGLSSELFQFCGFLPRTEKALKERLLDLLSFPGTTICYESPQRLLKTLSLIQKLAPLRDLVVAREMTKLHEQFLRGTSEEILNQFSNQLLKGEIVLLISGDRESQDHSWTHLTPAEHVKEVEMAYQLSRKEAIKMVAQIRGESKRLIYKESIE